MEDFLRSISEVASSYSSVAADDKFITIVHSFWSFDEIAKGREIQADWDLPSDLIAFYGNWHTLICISHLTGEVQLLDDSRKPLHSWQSAADFLNCLTTTLEGEDTASTRSGVIESEVWLDF